MSISSKQITLFSPTLYLTSQCPIISFIKPRKRNIHVSVKSRKLILDSACIIASKIGFLPHPLDLILRNQFGSGSGSGSGNGFGFGWSDGFFDGWNNRKRMKFGKWVLVFGLCLCLGKELGMDALLGCLGFVLFGVSVDVLRKGAKDWILGFVCCGFLIGLVFKKEELIKSLDMIKSGTRRRKLRFF